MAEVDSSGNARKKNPKNRLMKKKGKSVAAMNIVLALVHVGGASQDDTEEVVEVEGENSSFENQQDKEIFLRGNNRFAMDLFELIEAGALAQQDFIDRPSFIGRDHLGARQGQIIIVILHSQERFLHFGIWLHQCENQFSDRGLMVLLPPERCPEICHSAHDQAIFLLEKRCANLLLVQESQEVKWEDLHQETLVVILLLDLVELTYPVEEVLLEILAATSHSVLHGETLLALLREMPPEMAHSHLEL